MHRPPVTAPPRPRRIVPDPVKPVENSERSADAERPLCVPPPDKASNSTQNAELGLSRRCWVDICNNYEVKFKEGPDQARRQGIMGRLTQRLQGMYNESLWAATFASQKATGNSFTFLHGTQWSDIATGKFTGSNAAASTKFGHQLLSRHFLQVSDDDRETEDDEDGDGSPSPEPRRAERYDDDFIDDSELEMVKGGPLVKTKFTGFYACESQRLPAKQWHHCQAQPHLLPPGLPMLRQQKKHKPAGPAAALNKAVRHVFNNLCQAFVGLPEQQQQQLERTLLDILGPLMLPYMKEKKLRRMLLEDSLKLMQDQTSSKAVLMEQLRALKRGGGASGGEGAGGDMEDFQLVWSHAAEDALYNAWNAAQAAAGHEGINALALEVCDVLGITHAQFGLAVATKGIACTYALKMADPEPKQEGVDKKYLNLVVRNQLGEDVQFKVKLGTKFQKIFDAYNEKKGVSGHKFIYDGHRLHGEQTPAEYDMEDGDLIEAVLEQLGGGRSRCSRRISSSGAW
eukprot:gene10136-10294_t